MTLTAQTLADFLRAYADGERTDIIVRQGEVRYRLEGRLSAEPCGCCGHHTVILYIEDEIQ